MNSHYTIEIMSPTWSIALLLSLAFITLPIVYARYFNKSKDDVRKLLALILLSSAVLIQPYLIYTGRWSVQSSLPLHLCTFCSFLSGMALLWRNQLVYELIIYWGITGGIHSILTPELIHGEGNLLVVEYYLAHSGMILSPLYLTLIMGMRPRLRSWITALAICQIFLLCVGLADWLIDANYMYLRTKPIVDNPFVIGDWPYYILGFEFAGILHFYLIYLFFKIRINNKLQFSWA
jgi:hypothetical integral membrane protein (TIGR02206 family)